MARTHHIEPAARRDHVVQRASWIPALGPGMVLGAVSTVGVVVAMFMSWRTTDVHPSGIPFAFLFDNGTTAHDPTILLALIPFAVLLGVGTVMPGASAARIIGGLGVLAVVALFAIQLNQQLDNLPGANLGDVLDTGFYVAAISGFVGLVSGFLPSGWARRTETASSVDVGSDVYDEPRI
ncbi:MAG TPA: hypothetical protein VGN59_14070 [Acidimicrobiia bacterium]